MIDKATNSNSQRLSLFNLDMSQPSIS